MVVVKDVTIFIDEYQWHSYLVGYQMYKETTNHLITRTTVQTIGGVYASRVTSKAALQNLYMCISYTVAVPGNNNYIM